MQDPKPKMKNVQYKGDIAYHVKQEKGKKKWTPLGHFRSQATWDKYEKIIAPPSTTVQAIADEWFKNRTRPNHSRPLSANSLRVYRQRIAPDSTMMAMFGASEIKAIRPSFVQIYLDDHASPSSANRDIAVLSLVFKYAMSRDLATMNPCAVVKKNHEEARSVYMTDEEFQQMREALPVGMQITMDLLYLTGLRVSDVLKLKHSDIRDGYLHARERKTRQAVRYPLTDSLRAVLSRSLTDIGHVVTDDARRPLTLQRADDAWRGARDRMKMRKIQLRDIRAKHATDRDSANLNAQLALGHTSPAMTKRYLRHEQGRIVEPLEKMK